ncbi:MAG: PH domain-containing protein [Candidatus Merdivicinus sp.]|jgi:uncharacterized membrane protein YdbT with pleckstrin-like domain
MNIEEEFPILWKDRKHFMWFPWSFTRYTLDQSRLYLDIGLLNTKHDEVLLYRVVDISMTRSLAQRIFGTGSITLYTKVDISGEIHLKNIKNPDKVNRMLSNLIEQARNKKQVVGKEFYSDEHDCDHDFSEDVEE